MTYVFNEGNYKVKKTDAFRSEAKSSSYNMEHRLKQAEGDFSKMFIEFQKN